MKATNRSRSTWKPIAGAYWASQWRDTVDTLEVRDPQDGRLVGVVGDASESDVDQAVRAVATEVWFGQSWPAWRRREALAAASALLTTRLDIFAELISCEGSKTITEARREVTRAVETLRLSSEGAGQLTGETIPLDSSPRGDNRFGWYTREPVGVVAAITPFNDPLNLVAHKVGPALMAGNGVVLKPAKQTPLTALALAELLLQAGVPAGRLAVLPGRGSRAGNAVVSHPDVDLVSFTGGWLTGNRIAAAAGAKRTVMELGGNGAVFVLDDADVAEAAAAVVSGAFGAAGQNCISVQRVFVARNLAEDFLQRVVKETRELRVGDKQDPSTDIGPMISEREAARVAERVGDAIALGAEVEIGGERDGAFYLPTVLTGVPHTSKLFTEEIFGPVVCIEAFDDLEAVLTLVNSGDYGLHVGVFTESIDSALDVASQLRVGGVMINDTGDFRIDAMPFGGPKRSGVGREGVTAAIEAMTEPKVVIVRRRTSAVR
jgi:glyceraldehyde-3-phosphate dehydrogenase (NADP+)